MARRAKQPTRPQICALARVAAWASDDYFVPPCSSLIAAAEAIASLIAEYCPIAATKAKPKKVNVKQQRDNMMRVAGFILLEGIPDCQELFLAAETIARLIAENGCTVARGKK